MATPVFDAATTGTAANAGSLTFSHSVGAAGTNRLLIVAVSIDNRTVSGVTYNGVAMTSVGSATNGKQISHMWRLIAPATGANNVVVTLSGGGDDIIAVATSYTGVDQTTPLGTPATATGTSTTASVTVTSATNELVVDSVSSNLGTLTVDASQTQRGNAVAGDNQGGASEEAGAASVVMSWTIGSSSAWASVGVGIKGVAALTGTLNKTLGAVTSSATGKLASVATLNKTLDAVTLASSGKLAGVGTLNKTLGAVTLSSTGTVTDPVITGTLNKTLGALTLASAGSATIAGALNKTLGTLTLSGVGTLPIVGTLNKALSALSTTSAGTLSASGSLNKTLDLLTGNAVGKIVVSASLNKTLGALTLAATGALTALGTVARPNADTTAGGWLPSTGTSLFAMIDEVVADDTDYIYATTATTCTLALSGVVDPLTSSGQVVEYRAWSPTGTGGVTMRLKQGAVVIASWTHAAGTLPTVPTAYQQVLTAAECDAITDYTNLFVEPVAL